MDVPDEAGLSRVALQLPLGRSAGAGRDRDGAAAGPHVAEGRPRSLGLAGREPIELLAAARLALAVVIGLRLALSPFAAAVAGEPQALWRPRGTGLIFASPPPVGVVIGFQVLGVAGAGLHLWWHRPGAGRRSERGTLAPLVVAWGCLLVLAGLRTSLGKILHNDVLLVVAAGPLLLAGTGTGPDPDPDPDGADARTGLDAAAAIVLLSYLSAGWWKLLHSGPAWVLSDNLRWSLAAGRGGSHWPQAVDWLVGHPPACIALAGAMVALELGAPLLWLRPRLAPWFVAAAAAMHAGTWLTLGLDYWAHLATVALVLLPWARMRRR